MKNKIEILKFGAVGFLIGALLGSSMGITFWGTAIAGTVPMAIIGAYLGYRAIKPRNVLRNYFYKKGWLKNTESKAR